MRDVRCHLPQIGQTILPCEFAILDLQFVRQPLDFLAQCLVRLLQRAGRSFQAANTVSRSAGLSGGILEATAVIVVQLRIESG